MGAERVSILAGLPGPSATRLDVLIRLAARGLPQMWRVEESTFAHTFRAIRTTTGAATRSEGGDLRYTAIVSLAAGRLDEASQLSTLAGSTAAELARHVVRRARDHRDPGAVALAAWASAEVLGVSDPHLLGRLDHLLRSAETVPTVDCSWMLSAAVAAPASGVADAVITGARARLLQDQSRTGLFPHVLPAGARGRGRAHVACFADQVYPIQALARLSAARSDRPALAAADRAAERICEVQGPAGQWWWHYDVRDGSVVEGYPVYSVHQHAMGPMALLDLLEAGGNDHRDAVARGVTWLDTHPEVVEDLVSERWSVIWRKVGRAEPRKATRSLSALTTAVRPGLHLPGLDRMFPPTRVDHECRPYELGWLLYAWLSDGVVRSTRSPGPAAHA